MALPYISPDILAQYHKEVTQTAAPATAKRRVSSLRKFFDWAHKEGHVAQNPFAQVPPSSAKALKGKKASKAIKVGLVLGGTFGMMAITFLLIKRLGTAIPFRLAPAQEVPTSKIQIGTPLPSPFDQQSTIGNQLSTTTSPWTLYTKLNFKDEAGEPIQDVQSITFGIYPDQESASPLWTSPAQEVTPDAQGDVRVVLKDVPTSLFFGNESLFLEANLPSGIGGPRIPIPTASNQAQAALVAEDGNLLLAGESPSIVAETGNLLVEGQTVTIKTADASDGDIEINPDGSGIAHFLFEGNGQNFLNAQAPNLTKGSLYYGVVANNSTGYDLIRLQSGSPSQTRFSVDAGGNTAATGNLAIGGGVLTSNLQRLTSGGALTNITGYSQTSGNFSITQAAGDTATITKKGSALSDLLTLTLDERGKKSTGYSALTLKRYDGATEGYALFVDEGNTRLDGQLQLGRFTSNPTSIGQGSLVFNTGDSKVYVWDGSTWTAVGSGSALVVQEGDTTVAAAASTLDFLGGDFNVSESPANEANVTLATTLTTPTGVAGDFSIQGGDLTTTQTTATLFNTTATTLSIGGAGTTTLNAATFTGHVTLSSDATEGLSGGGLSDCDTASTSKLLWDATTNKFSCGTDSDTGASTTTLQIAYNNDADGSDTIVALTTGDDSLIFRNPAASGTDSAYLLLLDQLAAGDVNTLQLSNNGTGSEIALTSTTPTIEIANTGTLTVTDGTNTLFSIADDTSEGDVTVTGDLAVNGATSADITSGTTTATLFNSTVTTLSIGGAATTTLNAATFTGHVTLSSDASEGLSGGGLSDCDTASTSKLLWDATTNKFSCGTDSDTGASTTTLQIAYNNDADGSDAIIALTTADDSLIFRNPSSAGTDSAYTVFIDQLNTTGAVSALDISTASNGSDAVNLTANSVDGETILDISGTGLTTGKGILFTAGSSLTTGNAISVSSASYAPAAGATGSLINLALTDAAANTTSNSIVNGINIASTLNTSGATGTKAFNALNVAAPTFTACSGGACTWSGLNINGSTAGSGITEYGLNIPSKTAGAGTETAIIIGSGWDTGIDAGTNSILNIGDASTDISSTGATFGVHVTLSSDASEGLSGGGLADCDAATTSKLLWDATTNKFSCGTDTDSGGSTTLQTAYNNDADGSDAIIALTTADDSLIFRNPAASGTDSAFTLFIDQLNTTGGVTALDIAQASNAADAVNITANSIDTENALDISATALTSGVGVKFTGSSSTGITGSGVSLTSDIGSNGELINLAPDFSGAGVTGYATYLSGTQSANAANVAIGYYGTLSSSSTTADTLAVFDAATTTSGIIISGTRSVYGVRSQPASTGASTGGTTDVYGLYSKAGGTVGVGGTINAYGLYLANGTMDTTGTSRNIAAYFEPVSGADTNIGICFDCDGTWTSSTVAAGIQFGTDGNSVSLYRDGSDVLRTGDSVTIDLDLTVTGGDILGPSGENIDLGEATADTIIQYIGGAAELALNASALAPSTDSGLDLGTSSSQFADLYLDGGNINLDNATDIDIDDNTASALTISQGSNNYLAITTTDAAETVQFGNTTTNPSFSFLGTGGVTATGNITTSGDLAVNGGDITTTATTLNIDVANTGTINFRDGTNTLVAITDGGTTASLSVSGALLAGSISTSDFNKFGTNSTGHSGTINSSSDVLISGDLELDGVLYLDGGNISNSAGTANIILTSTPTTTSNTLTASSWKVDNTANVGWAALIVDQQKAGELFTASAAGVTKFVINNDGSIRLATDIASTSNTGEGTIFYDNNSAGSSSTDHLFLRGSDAAWHRIALDMTKYSTTNASVANKGNIEIAHNQGTNDLDVSGWFYDTVTSLWRTVSDYTHTIKNALQNEWDDAANVGFRIDTSLTLEQSLNAYWSMDEASGNRVDGPGTNDLTDNNTVGSATGKRSNAADFELDNSEFLELSDNASTSTGDIDFTLSAWVQLESESAGTTQETIISKYDSATVREYSLYYTGATTDRLQFEIFNSSGTSVCTATANTFGAVTTGTWYYILAYHDATANTCSISVNNGTADSAAETGTASDTAANLRVGANSTTEAAFLDGLIDEVGFWKKILTSTEKADLYNAGNANPYGTFPGLTRSQTKLTDVEVKPSFDTGTGADGAITVSSDTNINATSLISGRSCADGGDAVNYSVSSLTSTTATLESTPSAGCLAAGDEVLLINLRGTTSAFTNVGNYETLRISNISTNVVTFTTAKINYYGNNATDDTNIGLGTGNQAVMLQRIPNYTNVTVSTANTDFTPSDWVVPTGSANNGAGEGGVMFFRATGTVSVAASTTINANSKGFLGGAVTVNTDGGNGGEAFCGAGGAGGTGGGAGGNGASGGGGDFNSGLAGGNGSCGGGGGGGNNNGAGGTGSASAGGAGGGSGGGGTNNGGGGGGGYGTGGTGGAVSGSNGGTNSSGNGGAATTANGGGGGGGGTYGDASLNDLFYGSGGGAGNSVTGGDGGGVIYISADTLTVSGGIQSNGAAGGVGNANGNGGGGAGGSVKLIGKTLTLGTSLVTASAGAGGDGTANDGGAGGSGRIATYYVDSISGSTSPSATSTSQPYYPYGIYHSAAIATPNSVDLEAIRWEANLNTYGKIEVQTRTGATADPTDTTWQAWRPFTSGTHYTDLETANTHTNWVGTNATVADGDVTRNIDMFEDDDESTAGNLTKITSSTNGGYAEATITSTDLSAYDYVTFWVRASQTGNTVKFGIGESAATEQEETVTIDAANTWQKVYWDLGDVNTGARNAVTKLRLTNLTTASNTIYLDNVRGERLLTDFNNAIITSTPNDYLQYRIIFTTTNTTYQPMLENIYIVYNDGFKVEQVDTNTVRLYNYTGATQQLRLDAVVFGADLAEWYTVDDPSTEPGDVVSLTGGLDEFGVPVLRKANNVNDANLVGIISTKAGQALGVEKENRRLLALAGRVPVKIDPDSPAIKAGDYLTSSSLAGYATKATFADHVVGKAFEDWAASSGKETVLVLVTSANSRPILMAATENLKVIKNAFTNVWEVVDETTGEVAKGVVAAADFVAANIQAGIIRADSLAANSLIAATATIDNLLINSGLVSPVVQTALISPLPDDGNITVQIGIRNEESGITEGGKLAIQNAAGEEVASVDTEGNAVFEGTVTSEQLTVNSDATISGELHAGKIYADEIVSPITDHQSPITREQIEAILAEVEESQTLLSEAATWSVNTATQSGAIRAESLELSELYVTKTAALTNLFVTDSIGVGTDLAISSFVGTNSQPLSSINTISGPLQLQSLALAPVEIMAGKVRIETDGDVYIDANLYVAGTIESQSLKAENADINKLTTEQLIVAGAEAATPSAVVNGEIQTNATVGAAQIAAGVAEITIRNPKISDYTLVYITPTSPTENKTLYVKSKGAGFFTVGFSDPISVDVSFNWWVVETRNGENNPL